MINRTYPSGRSFMISGIKQKVPRCTSCCCIIANGSYYRGVTRNFSNNAYPGSWTTKGLEIEDESERKPSDIVKRYLNSLNAQANKSGGSLKRFEPSYRPLYPFKKPNKQQLTFKIPRKMPYIPAIMQRKLPTYDRAKLVVQYKAPCKHPNLTYWPPLYKCKRNNNTGLKESQSENKSGGELPSWLLPLYSYKTRKPEEKGVSEARYSGRGFQRRMEVIESMNEITLRQRASKENVTETINTNKEVKKKQFSNSKNEAQVKELKRMIEAVREVFESSRKTNSYKKTKGLGMNSKAEQTNSMEDGILDINSKLNASNQLERVVNVKMNSSPTVEITDLDVHNLQTLRNLHSPPEDSQRVLKDHVELKSDTLQSNSKNDNSRTFPIMEQVMKNQDSIVADSGDWSVDSLKRRIKDMRMNSASKFDNTSKSSGVIEPKKSTPSTSRQKIAQISKRPFHCMNESSMMTGPSRVASLTKRSHSEAKYSWQLSLCSTKTGRRGLSTFVSSANVNRNRSSFISWRRNISISVGNSTKRKNWLDRLKACFVIKKVKGVLFEEWKNTPRMIPYLRTSENCFRSPAPILWTPKEQDVVSNPEGVIGETTNPVVLNAEQRIMASVSRIVTSSKLKNGTFNVDELKPETIQPDYTNQGVVNVRMTEIERKVKKAKVKVNTLPWPKNTMGVEKIRTYEGSLSSLNDLQLGSCSVDNETRKETGYEWILKNKQIVDGLHQRSRQAAGKPLVPSRVKQSIEEFKLPLKVRIAQYRKGVEKKYPHGLYLYSPVRRFYSSSCNTRFLSRYGDTFTPKSMVDRQHKFFVDLGMPGKRYFSTDDSRPKKPLSCTSQAQNGSFEISSSKFYKKYALRPMYGIPIINLVENSHNAAENAVLAKSIKATKHTPLTSPNRSVNKTSEHSVSLKKQVENLKRLIQISKGTCSNKDNTGKDSEDVSSPEEGNYEMRLKQLVKKAHANATKLKIPPPKSRIENNLLNRKTVFQKKNFKSNSENDKNKLKGTNQGLLQESNIAVLNSHVARNKCRSKTASFVTGRLKNKKPFTKVYLKLKTFVDSVRRKSTSLERIPAENVNQKHSIDNTSITISSLLPSNKKESVVSLANSVHKSEAQISDPTVDVKLHADLNSTPSNTVQLWKGDKELSSTLESNVASKYNMENVPIGIYESHPTYREFTSLITRAKELIAFHSLLTFDELSRIVRLTEKNSSSGESKKLGNHDEGMKTLRLVEIPKDSLIYKCDDTIDLAKMTPQNDNVVDSKARTVLLGPVTSRSVSENIDKEEIHTNNIIPHALPVSQPIPGKTGSYGESYDAQIEGVMIDQTDATYEVPSQCLSGKEETQFLPTASKSTSLNGTVLEKLPTSRSDDFIVPKETPAEPNRPMTFGCTSVKSENRHECAVTIVSNPINVPEEGNLSYSNSPATTELNINGMLANSGKASSYSCTGEVKCGPAPEEPLASTNLSENTANIDVKPDVRFCTKSLKIAIPPETEGAQQLEADVHDSSVEEVKQNTLVERRGEYESNEHCRYAELLAKDPCINPKVMKKLKLPVIHESCNEKSWFTISQNNQK